MKTQPVLTAGGIKTYTARLVKRRWLSEKTFEIELARPWAFAFTPGQRIRLLHNGIERDYSLISLPGDETIGLCIRHLRQGRMADLLASIEIGSRLSFAGPTGYFTFQPSPRPAVFVATGTGVAPFVSMIRAGIGDFSLLHGVRLPSELYYQSLFRNTGQPYFPCLSGPVSASRTPENVFHGLVSTCLTRHFKTGAYDFYLCGRKEMIRDVTFCIDDFFPGSHVFTEIFY